MRKIEAVIRPEKVSDVKEALEKLGCPGITVLNAKGHGRQKGLVQQFRGQEYKIDLLPKAKLEIVVNNDGELEQILSAIIDNAYTGEVGDGKIFIWPIEDVIRIRTRERGKEAI